LLYALVLARVDVEAVWVVLRLHVLRHPAGVVGAQAVEDPAV
jgi:hypothetical protein